MTNFSKLSLQKAYLIGASEIADKILKDIYEVAKYSTQTTSYETKTYVDGSIAKVIFEILQTKLVDVDVTMKLGKEETDGVMVTYRADWS
jgi:hypothetical protein